MSQLATVEIKNKWELLEDIISEDMGTEFTFDADSTYEIQVRGKSKVLFLEAEELPEKKNNDGFPMPLLSIANYKKADNKLYVKAIDRCGSVLNISIMD